MFGFFKKKKYYRRKLRITKKELKRIVYHLEDARRFLWNESIDCHNEKNKKGKRNALSERKQIANLIKKYKKLAR